MSQTKVFEAGAILAHEGEPGNAAYRIVSGFLQISKVKDGQNVYIRQCGPDQIVGEMALIEDRPRTATITAITKTEVEIITEKVLSEELRKSSPLVSNLMAQLCDRIREKDEDWLATIDQTRGASQAEPIELMAASAAAQTALGREKVRIDRFPCRIGLLSNSLFEERFHKNDIELRDQAPFQISRSHITIDWGKGNYVVIDRNSQMGARVKGNRIGGEHTASWHILDPGDNELILGNDDSDYLFTIRI